MKIREFFARLRSKSELKDALEKIHILEQNIKTLELKVDSYPDHPEQQPEPIPPPLVVEKLHIEKISIDKFELSNNFGALGIKDLQGKLNIGANYGEGIPYPIRPSPDSKEEKPDPSETSEQEENEQKNQESGPRYTIKSKDI